MANKHKIAQINIRLTANEYAAFVDLAAREGLAQSRLFLRLLSRALKEASCPLPEPPPQETTPWRAALEKRAAQKRAEYAPDAHGIAPSMGLVRRRKRAAALAATLPLDVRSRAKCKRRRGARMRAR